MRLCEKAILEVDYLKSMARIPVYTKISCDVYDYGGYLSNLKTETSLHIVCLLVFFRNHVKRDCNIGFMEICKDDDNIKLIKILSELAYISLKDQNIIFTDDHVENAILSQMPGASKEDIKEQCEDINECGIIERYKSGEDGYLYQFTHLMFQEFFCSLYIGNNLHEKVEKPVLKQLFTKLKNTVLKQRSFEDSVFFDYLFEPRFFNTFIFWLV